MPLSRRGRKTSTDLARDNVRAAIQERTADGREGGLVEQSADPGTQFFFPPIQVSMLAEGRTSCDDGIQCPVCLLLRAFLLLITKQPDALLPSVVLSLHQAVLGLRGTVMHNSIYSHPQPNANASCFTMRQLYYFSFSHICKHISRHLPGTLRGR